MVLESLRALDPDSDVEADVVSHAQDPVADPHGAFRWPRKSMALVEASRALGQDGKPDYEDLVEGH